MKKSIEDEVQAARSWLEHDSTGKRAASVLLEDLLRDLTNKGKSQ